MEPHYLRTPSSPQCSIIQTTAIMVHNRGSRFEEQLKQRVLEKSPNDPRWEFLFHDTNEDNLYYRWCVLALGANESFASHSFLPFQFLEGGEWFVPPPVYDDRRTEHQLEAVVSELARTKGESLKRSLEREEEEARKEKRRKEELGWV